MKESASHWTRMWWTWMRSLHHEHLQSKTIIRRVSDSESQPDEREHRRCKKLYGVVQ